MKTIVFVLAAACSLCAPVAAQAATVPVARLSGDFGATNSSVVKVADGVRFGVYPDAGAVGGSLLYTGANGRTLGSLTALGYTYQYNTSDDAPIAAPYLRVFLDDNGTETDVILDPTHCATVAPAENEDHAVDVAASAVRYGDDPCTGPEEPFAAVQAAHADAVITGIFVTQGFSGGLNATALVRSLTVDGTTFAFDVPPVGPPGPAGAPGTTTIVRVPVAVPVAARPVGTAVAGVHARRSCRGDSRRRLHAPRRRGQRFLRVNAALRSGRGYRSLRSSGRTVFVDLRDRPEANYNVRLITRYRTKSGKVRRVVTRRHLSVACS
jgi:hypothetical protein